MRRIPETRRGGHRFSDAAGGDAGHSPPSGHRSHLGLKPSTMRMWNNAGMALTDRHVAGLQDKKTSNFPAYVNG